MPMTRFLLTACCALLPCWAMAAVPATRDGKKPGGGGATCPAFPVECQVNAPVFNFGRAEMSQTAPPVYSNATISVTCTRHPQDGYSVDVHLRAEGAAPRTGSPDARSDRRRLFEIRHVRRSGADALSGATGSPGHVPVRGRLLPRRQQQSRHPRLSALRQGGRRAALVPPGPFLGAVVSRVEYRFAGCIP